MRAHPAHPVGKCSHGSEHGLLLQVTQHIVAVMDRLDVVQRAIEERHELIFLAPRRQRPDDLVEIQVPEELGLLAALGTELFLVEQDALERRARAVAISDQ